MEEQLSGDIARPDQEGRSSSSPARSDKFETVAGRHPRHGRHPRRHVRDRRQQGRAGDQGSQHAGHSGCCDPRFERVSPDGIAFPIPANDDAARAIRLYCEAVAIAATRDGQEQQARSGVDIGAMAEPPKEEAMAEPVVEPATAAEKTPAVVEASEFTAKAEAAAKTPALSSGSPC